MFYRSILFASLGLPWPLCVSWPPWGSPWGVAKVETRRSFPSEGSEVMEVMEIMEVMDVMEDMEVDGSGLSCLMVTASQYTNIYGCIRQKMLNGRG